LFDPATLYLSLRPEYNHLGLLVQQMGRYCNWVLALLSLFPAAALSTARVSAATITVSSVSELRSAVAAAAPGDVIELTDGVYQWTESTLVTISDKSNLTIRSQSGNRAAVVLQGAGINGGTQFVFKLYRSPHFTAENMTLRDVYWHCVQVNEDSDYCTLRNLVMWDAGEGPVKVTSPGHSGPYSDYGLIEDCVIGYTTQGMRDVVEGIDIVGSVGWVIRNCEFYNVTKGPDPDLVGYGFFAKGNSQDTVVEGCYFENCDIPLSFGGGGTAPEWFRDGDMTYEHRGGIMRNNVVNGTKDVAIYMNSAHDFKVYNNTLWSTFAGYDSSIDSRFNSSGEIANNICSQYYHLRDGGAATEHHNLWHASLSLFEDPGSGNFHLVSGATSAIDQGADLTADVPTDMDGQTRPIGAAVDIGADEYRTPTFSDVTDAHWAVRQVEACAAAGVVGGFPDGTYRPSLPVTRDQMAVYISPTSSCPRGRPPPPSPMSPPTTGLSSTSSTPQPRTSSPATTTAPTGPPSRSTEHRWPSSSPAPSSPPPTGPTCPATPHPTLPPSPM